MFIPDFEKSIDPEQEIFPDNYKLEQKKQDLGKEADEKYW